MSAKTQERIDVVICTRNREGSIEAAVRGVLANDHPDFRLTIIDQSAMHAIGWALGPVLDTDDRLRYVYDEAYVGASDSRSTETTACISRTELPHQE